MGRLRLLWFDQPLGTLLHCIILAILFFFFFIVLYFIVLAWHTTLFPHNLAPRFARLPKTRPQAPTTTRQDMTAAAEIGNSARLAARARMGHDSGAKLVRTTRVNTGYVVHDGSGRCVFGVFCYPLATSAWIIYSTASGAQLARLQRSLVSCQDGERILQLRRGH